MVFNKINSEQIQDTSIFSRHLAEKVVTSIHLADKSVGEAALDIDWTAKASEILATKKVIDFVQGPGGTIAAGSSSITGISLSLPAARAADELGVVVEGDSNKAILLSKDGSKLLTDEEGNVIFGSISESGGVFTINLKVVGSTGAAVSFVATKAIEYQLQYAARFTLDTVSEMFAANEKFVDGAIDVATRLNVEQIAKDLFGASYTLNKDGLAVMTKTISEQVNENSAAITAALENVQLIDGKVSEVIIDLTDIENRVKSIEDANLVVRVADLETAVASEPKEKRADKKIVTETASMNLVTDLGVAADELPLAETVDLYVNGMLQMSGEHFAETVDGDGNITDISFTPNVVKINDIVQIRWER